MTNTIYKMYTTEDRFIKALELAERTKKDMFCSLNRQILYGLSLLVTGYTAYLINLLPVSLLLTIVNIIIIIAYNSERRYYVYKKSDLKELITGLEETLVTEEFELSVLTMSMLRERINLLIKPVFFY